MLIPHGDRESKEGTKDRKGRKGKHRENSRQESCSCRHVNRLTCVGAPLHYRQQSSVPPGAPPSPPGVLAAVQSPSPPGFEWLPLAPLHGLPPPVTEGKLPAHCNVLCTLVAGGGAEKGQNDKRSRGRS